MECKAFFNFTTIKRDDKRNSENNDAMSRTTKTDIELFKNKSVFHIVGFTSCAHACVCDKE